MNTTYHIEIDETQRVVLRDALAAYVRSHPESEAAILFDMFCALPDNEAAEPNIVHGFCY